MSESTTAIRIRLVAAREAARGLRLFLPLLIASLSCAPADTGESEAQVPTESGASESPAPAGTGAEAARSASSSSFLYVWAGAESDGDSDFLAVIDVDPGSDAYGEIVASAPVGLKGGAHHTEHVMPAGDTLFANSFTAGASFLMDLSDPLDPRVVGSFRAMGEYTYPHTFERLPGGNVLATFQTRGEGNRVAGGLVELDPAGGFVRGADAADPVDPELRAYSVTPIPAINRAVSTTSDMRVEAEGTSFQVWRLSDLTLLKTVRLPEGPRGYEHRDPAEVRLLPDSTTAIMTTFTCAMYLLHDLETDEPWAELIHVMPWETYDTDECGIPLTRGRFWVQTYANSAGSALISLDISDPHHPVVLDELTLDEPWWPHWISMEPDGERIVVTSGKGATLYRVLIVRLDQETGGLALDSTFRDRGSDVPGVSFDRKSWPHGAAGPARPHGAVFSRLGQASGFSRAERPAASSRADQASEDLAHLCRPFSANWRPYQTSSCDGSMPARSGGSGKRVRITDRAPPL
jgi:hypothetical protein